MFRSKQLRHALSCFCFVFKNYNLLQACEMIYKANGMVYNRRINISRFTEKRKENGDVKYEKTYPVTCWFVGSS